MAGTDRTLAEPGSSRSTTPDPAVILVRPQLGENIGAAARAMLNCGLSELRILDPRDGWPSSRAEAASSGALEIMGGAQLHASLADATADLHRIYATTARGRDMAKATVTPRQAAAEMRALQAKGLRSGILFGPERTGLTNDEVVHADAILTAPLNPAFSSLNLAQAVLLVAWEWRRNRDRTAASAGALGEHRPATKAEMEGFFQHLERALDAHGFFKTPELRPSMARNLRNFFSRAQPNEQEIRTLHGVIASLTGRRMDQH